MWSGTPYSDFKHLSWFWTPFSVSRLPCYSDLFFNILFLFPNIIVLFPNSLSCFRMPNTDLEHTISIFQLFLVFGSVYVTVYGTPYSDLEHLSWFWTPFSVNRLPCYSDLFFNILFLCPNIIVLFPNSLSCL